MRGNTPTRGEKIQNYGFRDTPPLACFGFRGFWFENYIGEEYLVCERRVYIFNKKEINHI